MHPTTHCLNPLVQLRKVEPNTIKSATYGSKYLSLRIA